MHKLGVIVADKNIDFTLQGILSRHQSLGIQSIEYQISVHPGHDGGVRTDGPEALDTLRNKVTHGLIMFDFEGSGAGPNHDAATIEAELDRRLKLTWGDKAKAIIIEPELDIWIWGADNAIRQVLDCSMIDFRGWLRDREYEFTPDLKPLRPKEALQELMNELNEQRSSAIYKNIVSKISLERCKDPAFLRFKATLQQWFA